MIYSSIDFNLQIELIVKVGHKLYLSVANWRATYHMHVHTHMAVNEVPLQHVFVVITFACALMKRNRATMKDSHNLAKEKPTGSIGTAHVCT